MKIQFRYYMCCPKVVINCLDAIQFLTGSINKKKKLKKYTYMYYILYEMRLVQMKI